MWSDAANGDVHLDVHPSGGTWGADELTVDTGSGTASAAWYVYANVLSQSGDQARVGEAAGVG